MHTRQSGMSRIVPHCLLWESKLLSLAPYRASSEYSVHAHHMSSKILPSSSLHPRHIARILHEYQGEKGLQHFGYKRLLEDLQRAGLDGGKARLNSLGIQEVLGS